MSQQPYLSTDPNAGLAGYLSTDPNAGEAVQPDFKITAEKPSWLDLAVESVKGAVNQVNPLPFLKALYERQESEQAEGVKQGGLTGAFRYAMGSSPLHTTSRMIAQGHIEQAKQAFKAAFEQGDYVSALGHAAGASIPLAGPAAVGLGEEMGPAIEEYQRTGDARKLFHALGGVAGLIGPSAVGMAVRGRGGVRLPGFTNPNAVENAAVAFGQAEGIPIDAGTATGSRFVSGVQKMAESTPLGALVERGMEGRRAAALTATGQKLAARAAPDFATPEQAGTAVRTGIEGLIGDLHEQANTAYGKLRAIEQSTEGEWVRQPPPALATDPIKAGRARATAGGVPSEAELSEMRRIGAELDAKGYEPGKLLADGTYSRGSRGVPVYDDILEAAPGTSEMTRGEVAASIKRALETGTFTNAAKGALEVARKRLAGSQQVSSPVLPPSAGEVRGQVMPMAVDFQPVQEAIAPIYNRLKREAELVPLMGGKAQVLTVFDRIMNGPRFAPVSVADAALSDLKGMSRGADLPELRSQAQGSAARAVRTLEDQVQAAVEKAGPEAVAARDEGRAATVAKYAAKAVLEDLQREPVKAYRQATAPKDTAIGYLKQLKEMAPSQIEKIGRAWIDTALRKATKKGGFKRGQGLSYDWEQLGDSTKEILFGPELTADLDKFFLLAERLGTNPNTSGTALAGLAAHSTLQAAALFNPATFWPAAVEIFGMAGVAKLLHSPVGVKLLTRALRVPGASTVARGVVLGQLMKLAADEGVVLPRAADSQESQPAGVAGR